MTEKQRRAVEQLFYVFGNGGAYYTLGNHEFLRRTLAGELEPEHFQPTKECKIALQKVMDGDYSPLPARIRRRFAAESV